MNIEEYEEEIKEVQGQIDVEVQSDPALDLGEALGFLEGCREIFNALTVEDENINMPLELELNIYKLDKQILTFLSQWET